MTTENTFIDINFLKAYSTIDLNLDDSMIVPSIILAQKIHVLPILGTDFYNELLSKIENSIEFTGLTATMVEQYIKPSLVQYSVFELLPSVFMRITNKSVEKKNSDNSQSVDLSELKYLRADYKEKAEFLAQRLIDFLNLNIDNSELSTYKNQPCSCIGKIMPNRKTAYDCGMFFKKKVNHRNYFFDN